MSSAPQRTAMNYLVDTNIFLEILLGQAGRKKCEAFLQGEKGAA